MTKPEKTILTIVAVAMTWLLIGLSIGINNDAKLTKACLGGNLGACEALKGN